MEYVQERVTTLHAFDDPTPAAPTDRSAVVVPMTDREYAGLAADRVLSTLSTVSPRRVVVALRAPADRVPEFVEWLSTFEGPIDLLWCNAPAVEAVLDDAEQRRADLPGHLGEAGRPADRPVVVLVAAE
ncbi:glycosyl transferase family 2, partial [Halobacteriales archaeon QS_9_68_17]